MLLAQRGWNRLELATARPEFLAAARWALFAERLAPVLENTERLRDTPLSDGMDNAARTRLGMARMQAGRQVELLRAVLFPPDEQVH